MESNGIQWNYTFLKSLSTLSFLDYFSDSGGGSKQCPQAWLLCCRPPQTQAEELLSHWNSMEFHLAPNLYKPCRFLVILVIQGQSPYAQLLFSGPPQTHAEELLSHWNLMEFNGIPPCSKACLHCRFLTILVIQVGFKFQTLKDSYSSVGLLRRLLRSCCHNGIQWNSMELHLSQKLVYTVVS